VSADDPIILNEHGRTPFEDTLCNTAGAVLARAYPGYNWAVRVEEANGMFYILCTDLAGDWGYRGKVGNVYSSSSFEKEVLMAGGGILEHFGAPRRKADHALLAGLPTDFTGRVLPSNMPSFQWASTKGKIARAVQAMYKAMA
jgi:hypothetical protein